LGKRDDVAVGILQNVIQDAKGKALYLGLAVDALCEMSERDTAARGAVAGLLTLGDEETRLRAAETLASLGRRDRAVHDALRWFVDRHDDPDLNPQRLIRASAAIALFPREQVAQEALDEMRQKYPRWWTVEDVAQLRGPIRIKVAFMRSALKSTEARRRQLAAWELGKIGAAARDALPELRRLQGDSDRWVRLQASDAIRRIKACE
jgi:hypothetical protein